MNVRVGKVAGRVDQASPHKTWHFDIIVADGFVLLELAAIVDAIRIANRISAHPPFSWTYRSAKGGMIESRCEAYVSTEPYAHKPTADYAFFIGNSDPDNPALSFGPQIQSYTYRNARVVLLAEAASRYINERGHNARRLATHWENSAMLRERSSLFDADSALASEDGLLVTCAGMGATMDVVLAIMRKLIPSAALMTVTNVLLHESIRDFGTRQPFGGAWGTTGDSELDQCIEIMQTHVEDPVPISGLVDLLGISNRSLERKFKSYLGTTPNTYYRELRLAKANNLLLNTTMSVQEIGIACGFPNGFSSLYKSFFGITPFALRKQRRSGANRT